jgi:16S rRNA (uracil1498-N3)-methyltransferase
MSQIQLTEAQSHYLTSVIRLLKRRKDEPLVRLFDGRSGEWLARVRADDKESGDEDGVMRKKKHKNRSLLHVECLSLLRPQQKSRLSPCWLCVPAPASKERLRWMLEKATELNVDRIVFLETDYSASTQSKAPGSLRKAHAYLVEAAEQAERLTLPAFVRLLPALTETTTAANTSSKSYDLDERDVVTTRLSDLLDFVRGEPTLRLLVCRERTPAASSVSLWQALVDSHRQENVEPAAIAFCIGPEGGWSPNEESHLDELEAQYPGSVINVSLGPTVLRVETAAISALAAHNCFCDDRVHRS